MADLTSKKRAVLQRKLNHLANLANELDDEAKRLFGPNGFLFFESGGGFHLMDGDADGMLERQQHIKLASQHLCRMGAGAW